MVVQPKLPLTRSTLCSLYSMQAGPYDNISIDNGRAASYLNPNPNSFYNPRPATAGYTSVPSYGTPDYANAYHPTWSHWQTGFDQHTYASINTMSNSHMAQHQPVQNPHQLPAPFAPTVEHKSNSKRATTHWSKLKASSGIVSASQLKPGQSPSKPLEFTKLRSADRVRNIACPICEGTFVTPYQLQAHFPACVKRNGNPDGLFWDETLPLKWRRYGKADTVRSDEVN